MFEPRHPALHRKVLISLKTGNAVSGLLARKIGDTYVLKGCTVHAPGTGPSPADGEVLIEQENVDYMQTLDSLAGA